MAAKLTQEEKYMKAAIREAKKAWALGEVPIGCVIVYEDKIIGRGYNRRMVDHSALAHAEIAAIKKACKRMGDWRLEECELYVTLEPCPILRRGDRAGADSKSLHRFHEPESRLRRFGTESSG